MSCKVGRGNLYQKCILQKFFFFFTRNQTLCRRTYRFQVYGAAEVVGGVLLFLLFLLHGLWPCRLSFRLFSRLSPPFSQSLEKKIIINGHSKHKQVFVVMVMTSYCSHAWCCCCDVLLYLFWSENFSVSKVNQVFYVRVYVCLMSGFLLFVIYNL